MSRSRKRITPKEAMTRPLAEVVREWPHELPHVMSRPHRCKMELGNLVYMFDASCLKCAIERWMREMRAEYKCDLTWEDVQGCGNEGDVANQASCAAVQFVLGVEADDDRHT